MTHQEFIEAKEDFVKRWLPKRDHEFSSLMLKELNGLVAEVKLLQLSEGLRQPDKETLIVELSSIRSGAFSNNSKEPHASYLIENYFLFTKFNGHAIAI